MLVTETGYVYRPPRRMTEVWVALGRGSGLTECVEEKKGRCLIMERGRERTLVKKRWWTDGRLWEREAAGLRA